MAMSNVFCKTGWTLRMTLKTSLKRNSKKGAQSGRTWELLTVEMTLTVSKRLTQSNMCIVNTSQWGPEAMSCLGLPRSIFQRSQGTFSIYHRLGQVFSVCSWLPIHNAVLGDTKILHTFWLKITSSWKKYGGKRIDILEDLFLPSKKKLIRFCVLKWCIPFELDLNSKNEWKH